MRAFILRYEIWMGYELAVNDGIHFGDPEFRFEDLLKRRSRYADIAAGNFRQFICELHADGGVDWDLLLRMEGGGTPVRAFRHVRLADAVASRVPHCFQHRDDGGGNSGTTPRPDFSDGQNRRARDRDCRS